MNQGQKAMALEAMMQTPGWQIVYDYLVKASMPDLMAINNLDSLINQAYQNGVCQGHKDVLNFIKVTVDNAKRKTPSEPFNA